MITQFLELKQLSSLLRYERWKSNKSEFSQRNLWKSNYPRTLDR